MGKAWRGRGVLDYWSADFEDADPLPWEGFDGIDERDVAGDLHLLPVEWAGLAEGEVARLRLKAAELVSPFLFAPQSVGVEGVESPERVAFDLVVDQVAFTLQQAPLVGLSESQAVAAARTRAEELADRVREAGLGGVPDLGPTSRPPERGVDGVPSVVGGVGQREPVGGEDSERGSVEGYPGESQAGPSTVQAAAHQGPTVGGAVASGQQDAEAGGARTVQDGRKQRRTKAASRYWAELSPDARVSASLMSERDKLIEEANALPELDPAREAELGRIEDLQGGIDDLQEEASSRILLDEEAAPAIEADSESLGAAVAPDRTAPPRYTDGAHLTPVIRRRGSEKRTKEERLERRRETSRLSMRRHRAGLTEAQKEDKRRKDRDAKRRKKEERDELVLAEWAAQVRASLEGIKSRQDWFEWQDRDSALQLGQELPTLDEAMRDEREELQRQLVKITAEVVVELKRLVGLLDGHLAALPADSLPKVREQFALAKAAAEQGSWPLDQVYKIASKLGGMLKMEQFLRNYRLGLARDGDSRRAPDDE
ncbi:hypothetical protein [Saccharopolyspora sp. ASAGF58]|uniref:hypothetical protein n=1 Tax=Saccharopolyspora sp. ASAGF58 TaxID=2719023 RepID=UPI00143FBA3C|nr:hypothetical protein [Saccharopolyspora sp. ASAGF58]QIZ38779.1 hypothetical protein FDZ84_35140 [Saccharopolyspora sp. ASAGF58]